MTGTARTEATEFTEIYGLNIVTVPTNRAQHPQGLPRRGLLHCGGQVPARHRPGDGVPCQGPAGAGGHSPAWKRVRSWPRCSRSAPGTSTSWNAKNHEREAEIVAQAGKKGAITIATNMAGRGTDIMLGGNAEFMAKAQMRKEQFCEKLLNPEAPQDALPEQVEDLLIEADGHSETSGRHILAARARFDTAVPPVQGGDRQRGRGSAGRRRPVHHRHRAPRRAAASTTSCGAAPAARETRVRPAST